MIVETEEVFESEDPYPEYKVLNDAHEKVAGRSILFILQDRSIHSSSSWNHQFGKRKRKIPYLLESAKAATSPSSVISEEEDDDDGCKNPFSTTMTTRTPNQTSRSTSSPSLSLKDIHNIRTKANHNHNSALSKMVNNYKTRKYKNRPYSANILREIIHFVEKQAVSHPKSCYLPLLSPSSSSERANHNHRSQGTATTTSTNSMNPTAVSTIAIAFAPNGRTMASTHGDHTVKVSSCHNGRLIRSLIGHLRTPWTVKYHPTNSNIIASGCLGFQVRIWNWNHSSSTTEMNDNEENDSFLDYEQTKGVCLYTLHLQDAAIISMSFHPSGSLLAIASGNMLFLWDYAHVSEGEVKKRSAMTSGVVKDESSLSSSSQDATLDSHATNNNNSQDNPTPNASNNKFLPFNFKYTLRCVIFPPHGNTILVGVANPTNTNTQGLDVVDRHRRQDKKGSSYSLCMLDFDIQDAYSRLASKNPTASLGSMTVLKNVRIIIPRVLLYNDGGLDVSYDGKTVCACAEYLLPYGTECVMDMPENRKHDDSDDEDDDEKEEDKMESDSMGAFSEQSVHDNKSNIFDSPTRQSSTASTDIVDECRTPPRIGDNGLESMPPPPCPPAGTLRRYALEAAHERRLRLQFARPKSTVVSEEQLETAIQTRLVPHIVTVNIDSTSPSKTLGQVLEAAPLSESKAPGVTCVKFSPSTEYCLLGFGVRDKENTINSNDDHSVHPVISIYRCKGTMAHVSTAFSCDDDVNIALFHPESGHGMVYGTKQGRVKVLATMPWK